MVPPIPSRRIEEGEEVGVKPFLGYIAHRCALREIDVQRVIQSLAWLAGGTLRNGYTFYYGNRTTIKLKAAFNEEFGTFQIITDADKKGRI